MSKTCVSNGKNYCISNDCDQWKKADMNTVIIAHDSSKYDSAMEEYVRCPVKGKLKLLRQPFMVFPK